MNSVPPDLFEAAKLARDKAYAPYSGFKVGAAVRAANGKVYGGCNVENAAYPEGLCAEAAAIAAMIGDGQTVITEVAVLGNGEALCTPCGGCRQKLREFAAPDAQVHICNPEGECGTFTLDALLPHSFGPDNLS